MLGYVIKLPAERNRTVQTICRGTDRKGMASAMPIKVWLKAHTSLPQAGVKPEGRND